MVKVEQMTDYPQIQDSINRLNKLLTEIWIKEDDITSTKEYNARFTLVKYENLGELENELEVLKEEYRDLTRKIKIK